MKIVLQHWPERIVIERISIANRSISHDRIRINNHQSIESWLQQLIWKNPSSKHQLRLLLAKEQRNVASMSDHQIISHIAKMIGSQDLSLQTTNTHKVLKGQPTFERKPTNNSKPRSKRQTDVAKKQADIIPPIKEKTINPDYAKQTDTLIKSAVTGTPFCEECET